VLDPSIAPDWEKIDRLFPGGSTVISDYSDDKKTWLLVSSCERAAWPA
jgi:hypothetical protein